MKKIVITILTVLVSAIYVTHLAGQERDLTQLDLELQSMELEVPGLLKSVELNVNNVSLPNFLQAIAATHEINLTIDQDLSSILLTNSFTNATVKDVLLWLCREYNLNLQFLGNIITVSRYEAPQINSNSEVQMSYNQQTQTISFDLKNDSLYRVCKAITNNTGINIAYSPELAKTRVRGYVVNLPINEALDNLGLSNNIDIEQISDGSYILSSLSKSSNIGDDFISRKKRPRNSQLNYRVVDQELKLLDVDFYDVPIEQVIYALSDELDVDMFVSYPLREAGTTSVRSNNITFTKLLDIMLEDTEYSYAVEDSVYLFGRFDQGSVRVSEVIPLMHRSIEIMHSDITIDNQSTGVPDMNNLSNGNFIYPNRNRTANSANSRINTNESDPFTEFDSKSEALVKILPQEILTDLEVNVDIEQNSFIVSGPSTAIARFREFVKSIDKEVPVILIEVMVIEVNNTATVETGISSGLGDAPSQTTGTTFPNYNVTLGANTINRIIGNFDGFGSLNVGQVVPNFYVQLKAMETNGDIKIKSSPKLSTLNGHRATLSIGETTYYGVTQRNVYGSQNPQTSEITNYYPIDAKFGINIRPIVSGDGQITLDINVVQSDFNNLKVAEDAPPGINSREFNSTIRVKDQDLIILGGLEEKIKDDTGTGVPFLSRVPVIKWFFSSRRREDTKRKLSVLIKPTIIP